MNDVLTLLRNHRSFRKYKKGVEIPEEKLDAIIGGSSGPVVD